MKVGILGVTGYAGMELANILHKHPNVDITGATSRNSAGKKLGDVVPQLSSTDLTITEELDKSVDMVFSALPQTASAEALKPLLKNGVKSIDISGDFRLKSPSQYKQWYETDHPCPQYLKESVYGLPELNRSEIMEANLIANPGCYPTAIILALIPAIQTGIIKPDIIADAKSGISGAGQKLEHQYLYTEANENIKAYAIDGHRHLPEIIHEMQRISNSPDFRMTFVPHLVPMTRGLLATIYASLSEQVTVGTTNTNAWVRQIYRDFYINESFVKVTDHPPTTKETLGSNRCLLYPSVDRRTNRLIIISCIDNLVKGAAGQAVQNMNLMFSLPEKEGLERLTLYP